MRAQYWQFKTTTLHFTMNIKLFLQCLAVAYCTSLIGCEGDSVSFDHREDELLGGLTFGMTQKEFFSHCMQQQKLGLMRDGLGNFVQQDLPSTYIDSFSKVEYYPEFNEQLRIINLPGRVYSVA